MADIPITREEKYLAYLTGDYKADVPKPITRQERYLYELCLKGMGGEISPEEIQKAVNDYLDKNPVKPGATTEQAAQIEQNKTDIASLKTETSSLKESMTTKIAKFYASNQGETHLADSDDGKIMDMMVYGRSEQKQYSGKNLLKQKSYIKATKNGITYETINNELILSGTATGEMQIELCSNRLQMIELFRNGGVFTLSEKNNNKYNVDSLNISFTYRVNGSTEIMYALLGSTVTIPPNSEYINAVFWIDNGKKVDCKITLQFEKGSEATSYEPYTGGIPSPNPDYPQEIKSVVNPTVKVCGKNLLNYDAWKGVSIIRGTAIYENNGITLTATGNDCYSEIGKKFPDNAKIKVSEGETLTLSWEEIENKEGYIYIFGNGIASAGVSIDNKKSKKLSYTVPSGVTFITFRFGVVNAGDTISYKNIQIEKGSTPTSYEPYHEQTVTLPYTLNAIPVSAGGNVTIDGQQYVSDYFDVERGKLVRCVGKCNGDNMFNVLEYGPANTYQGWTFSCMEGKCARQDCVCSHLILISEDQHYAGTALGVSRSYDTNNLLGITLPKSIDSVKQYFIENNVTIFYQLETPIEIDLTPEEIAALKALATYYQTTNISVNSEQLDGYTVFNYPISLANGWNYVKQQIGDTREYIYDMDARTQDTDLQAAEAYVNSEYAVALTELEI